MKKLPPPPGVKADPVRNKITLPPEQESPVDFELEIEPEKDGKRRVLLADISFDGRYLGQAAELVIDRPIAPLVGTIK